MKMTTFKHLFKYHSLLFTLIFNLFVFTSCYPGGGTNTNNTNNSNNTNNNSNNYNNNSNNYNNNTNNTNNSNNNSNNYNNSNNSNNYNNNSNNSNNYNNSNNSNNYNNNSNNSNNTNNTNNYNDVIDVEDDTNDGGDIADTPFVHIDSPSNNALVQNPVTFLFTASNVDTVRFIVDNWPLSDPFTPTSEQSNFSYTFTGTGYARNVVLEGYDSQGNVIASHSISITIESSNTDPGDHYGSMWNTYYILAVESDYSGPTVTLYDSSCNPLTTVPQGFSDSVCIQGSGKLDNGTVIHYAGTCTNSCPSAPLCYNYSYRVCYELLDPNQYPWGMGNHNNPITPLRSWAVDNNEIPMGAVIYAVEWDGVYIPQAGGVGGFTHDGCFIADDTGGAIDGNHFDFFAGPQDMWSELETIFPTHSTFDVYINTPKCNYLLNK